MIRPSLHLTALVALTVASLAKAQTAAPADIVATAVQAGSFNTLVAAVKAAGLEDALKAPGPLTVFAPTDEAFAKLPAGTVENLLKPENRAQLTAILTYHVVPGKWDAAKVSQGGHAATLQGQRLSFKSSGGAVLVGSARVVKADVNAANGVIHAIDQVLLPASKNIVDTAADAGKFNTLIAAAKAAGLAEALSTGTLTVFAPTDEAFAKLPAGTVENLLKPENREQLASILKYHVVSGRVYSDQAVKAGNAMTLLGRPLRIAANQAGGVTVNGANVITADVEASNGVIHIIDTVILPQ